MLKIEITTDEMDMTKVGIVFDGDLVEAITLTPDVMRALAEYIAINGVK